MKKLIALLTTFAVFQISCYDPNEARPTPEMKEFLTYLDGTTISVQKGFKIYASNQLDTKGMDKKQLRDPKLISRVDENDYSVCFILEAKDSLKKTCTYKICWLEGKISTI